MDLFVSGGIHLFSSNEHRIQEIRDALGDVEGVCVEGRTSSGSPLVKARNWIVNPLILAFLQLWLILLEVGAFVIPSDKTIAERLADDKGLEIHKVDKPIHDILSRGWHLWGIANWVMLVIPILLMFSSTASNTVWFSIVLLVFSGLGLFTAFLIGTVPERNLHMLQEIDRIQATQNISKACLVTGAAHESGLRKQAELFEDITIVGDRNGSLLGRAEAFVRRKLG